jgi:hypothetical protein
MTNEVGSVAHVDGRFRPESISHFKEVAKNIAWLLDRPLQKCQEDLARIYGFSGLHELQQVLKQPGTSGPFAPRYNYLSSDNEALVEDHEQRIFFVLFGVPKRYWRDDHLADDKSFLVFEMGLFQEAAEHRACVEKIKQVLDDYLAIDRWPLIHGWPLGLRSWLASRYTEPFSLAKDWHKKLPPFQYGPLERADLRWQSRMTGLLRLETMFQILAPRVGGRKPSGMGRVAFNQFGDTSGLLDPTWEQYYLVEWLTKKLSRESTPTMEQTKQIQSFVERPGKSTAAECEFVKDLKDPAGFRDRWAFESFKASLDRYMDASKAQFSSCLDDGAIRSLFLHMDSESAGIGESFSGRLWQFNYTQSEVTEPATEGGRSTLQPVVHANGSLIVPFDDSLITMSPDGWYFSHDSSEFANSAAAAAFEKLYLPAIGETRLDFTYREAEYSIIEIDELLVAASVDFNTLKSYFTHLLDSFDDDFCLPDSYGLWCETLSLVYEDDDENTARHENFEHADYVHAPAVLLIAIQGCGLTFVEATHKSGKLVSTLTRDASKTVAPSGAALASMVMEAVKGLALDVVIYDEVPC